MEIYLDPPVQPCRRDTWMKPNGKKIYVAKRESEEDCARLCQKIKDCDGYRYAIDYVDSENADDKDCILFNGVTQLVDDDDNGDPGGMCYKPGA